MPHRTESVGPRLKAIRTGLKTGLPHGTKSLKVGDRTYSVSQLDQAYAALEKLFDATVAAHAALDACVDARDRVKPEARELLADTKVALVALLGRRSKELTLFGISPERPRNKADRKANAEKPAA